MNKIEVTTSYKCNLSIEDVKALIIEHFKNKGFLVEHFNFKIDTQYDPADFLDRYGPDYVFGGVNLQLKPMDK